MLSNRFNHRLHHCTGTDTTSAHTDMLSVTAVGCNSDCLQIRQPATASLVVGMADVITGRWLLAT